MVGPLSLIKDISPSTPQPWTVKVTVVEKTHVREARASPTKFQRLVVADSENTRIQITLFNENIKIYHERLELFGTYYISNASVRPVPAMYSFEGNPYQWSMHSRCVVQKVLEDAGPIVYAFEPVDALPNYVERDARTAFDMLLIILRVLPQKKLSARSGRAPYQEMIVVDQSLKPVVLTLWDQFVREEAVAITAMIEQKPIVAAMHLKAAVYDGISIRTRSTTSFQINPAIPPVIELRGWMSDHLTAVDALMESPELEALARNFAKDVTNVLRTISYVHSRPNLKFFHMHCRLDLLDIDQSFVRNYCDECNGTTSAQPAEVYTCNMCHVEVTSLTGARMEVIGVDETGSLSLSLYGDDVASFLGFATEALFVAHINGQAHPLEKILYNGSGKKYTVQVNAHSSFYMGSMHRKFNGRLLGEIAAPGLGVSAVAESSSTGGMTASAALKELGALQTAVVDGSLDISAEDGALLHAILNRQKLKGNCSQPFLTGPDSMSSVDTAMDADGEARVDSEIANCDITEETTGFLTPTRPTCLELVESPGETTVRAADVCLGDEHDWEILMKGPTPLEKIVKAPSPSTKIIPCSAPATQGSAKKDGKDRAPSHDKESPKVMRKLDM